MRILQDQTLTGQLFSWKKDQTPSWTNLPNISIRPFEGGWSLVTWTTEKALLVDDDLAAEVFSYEYLLRVYAEHVIFLSTHNILIEVFLNKTNLLKSIQKPFVEVDLLVKELSKKPHTLYTISRVYADVDGYGRKLRKMSLFGDDLVDVPTFQELLPVLVANRAEMRNVRRRMNVLCIDKEGSIDFYYRDNLSLKLMLDALSFLSTGTIRHEYNEEPTEAETTKPFINW